MKINLIFSAILCFCNLATFAAKPIASQIVHDFYAAVDAGDFDKAATFLSDDVMVYIPFSPQAMDKMAYKQLGMGMKTGFPDMQHKVLDVSESKGMVAFKGLFTGTNTGSLQGNPPTGNRVETPFLGFLKLDKKGKITEVNIQFDVTSFNAQLMKGINMNAAAEATIRGIMAASDAGNVDQLISYFAPDAKHYFGGQLNTNDELKKRVAGFKTGFPDIRRNLEEIIVNNNVATIRGWVSGTNTGMFMGQPATGNKIKLSVLGLYKFNAEGKVVEAWVEFDGAALMAQLKAGASSTETNKQTALKIMEALDKRDLDGVCAAFAPGAKFSGWTPQPVDVNGYRAAMSDLLAAFPDSRFMVDDVIVEGNKVVVRHHLTGTHTGAKFQGTPASMKKVITNATVIFQFKDGKPTELWLNADAYGLLLQIGALPMPKS